MDTSSLRLLCAAFAWHSMITATAAPVITATKDDNLAAGLRKLPGNMITYTTTLSNTGDATATAVQFTDPDPANTTFVSVFTTPIARNDTYSALGNVQISIPAGTGFLANDNDADNVGPALTVTAVNTAGTQGNVAFSADGSFTFNPTPGFEGATTFTYTLSDGESNSDTATVTVNISGMIWFVNSTGAAGDGRLTSPFNSLAAFQAINNGTGNNPAANDNIFLFENVIAHTGPVTLLAGQKLIGQDATATLVAITGVTVPTGSATLPAMDSANATTATITTSVAATNAINLTAAASNTLRGFSVGNTTGAGIASAASFGTLTISDMSMAGTGQRLALTAGTLNATFTTLSSSSSASAVSLTTVAGSLTVTSAASALSGATAAELLINGGAASVTFPGTITNTAGRSIDIQNKTGGTVAFSGAINDTGTGISLTNNTGGAITFSNASVILNTGTNPALTFTNTAATGAAVSFSGGNLNLDTTTGTGINATSTTTGAGSLTISGANNSVSAVGGQAMKVDGVTLNATLRDVSASGGTSTGVFLKNTGSGGQLVVTGTGSTAGTGGTITSISGGDMGSLGAAATTGTGIYLENASNVSLSNLNFTGTFSNFGIRGEGVTNFTMRDSAFTGTYGTNVGLDEGAIRFGTESSTTGIKGTALFEGNNVAGGFENNLSVFVYGNDSLTMTVKDSTNDQAVFGLNSNALGDDSLHVESGGTGSTLNLTVDGVSFNGARGDQLQTIAIGVTNQTLTMTNNQILNGHANIVSGGGGVDLLGGDTSVTSSATINFNFSNNTIRGAVGTALDAVYTGHQATINGVIINTQIGTINGALDTNSSGGSNGGGEGINVGHAKSNGTGSINFAVRLESNDIYDIKNGLAAIRMVSNSNGGGSSRLEGTVKDNINGDVVGSDLLSGFYAIVGGQGATDPSIMGLNLTGNTFRAGGASGSNAIYLDQIFTNSVARFNIPGYNNTGSAARGEFRSSGTASAALSPFWSGTNGALVNGPFPDQPGKVMAGNAFGITNTAFGLTVPLLFAPGGVSATPAPRTADVAVAGEIRNLPDAGASTHEQLTLQNGKPTEMQPADKPARGFATPAGNGERTSQLTQTELENIVIAARDRWAAAGLTSGQLETVLGLKFEVTDLPGLHLGEAAVGLIRVDSNAGGNGWFIGGGAESDALFAQNISPTRRLTDPESPPAGSVDLLTTILHEMGHALGLEDSYAEEDRNNLMYGFLTTGERRFPAKGQAAGATPHSGSCTHLLSAPLNIGDLPAGKTVTITYVVTINATSAISTSSQGTVTGTNIANKLTNDPQTGPLDDATITPIHQPPVVNNVGPLSLNEDAMLTFSGAIFNGSYSDPNSDGLATVRITSLPANGVLKNTFATITTVPHDIAIGSIGNLSYTPNADFNGSDGFGWSASDGTLFAVSAATVNLSVTAVNDKPTFTAANPPSVNEDAGAQTVPGWVTNFNPGAANESVQTVLAYTVSAIGTPGLFSAAPAVANNGTLTYTPTANASGSSTFTVKVQDNGGVANSGIDLSDGQVFTITVLAVNDAPVITGQNAVSTPESVGRAIAFADLAVTDVDHTYPTGFSLTVSNGTNYALAGNTVTPAAGFTGTLSVPVKVNDGLADSNTLNLAVVVNPTTERIIASSRIAPEPGGGYRISFIGNPGVSYAIQYSTTLVAGSWLPLGSATANANSIFSIVDTPPVNTPKRFYRAVVP